MLSAVDKAHLKTLRNKEEVVMFVFTPAPPTLLFIIIIKLSMKQTVYISGTLESCTQTLVPKPFEKK
jgi:hypothetical protein